MSVAVVILNWNGKHYLESFLPVLMGNTRVSHQKEALGSASPHKNNASIFVADNGSTDGSVDWIEWAYPQHEVNVIKFDQNYGFATGYNKAFEEISKMGGKFKYYLLLNSDVEVTPGWLDALVAFMDSHPYVGICSPKVRSYSDREYFEHAGACGGLLDRNGFPYCRGRVMSTIEKDEGQYDSACEVFWASGTSFMIRASLWHRLRGLDDSFFAHMEEIDLCWRAKLLGKQVWVVPQSVIYHVGGGTLPNNSPQKLYLNFRNNLLMLFKNLPQATRCRIIARRKFIDLGIALVYLCTFKWSFFKAVLRAHRDYYRMKKHTTRSEIRADVPWSAVSVFKLSLQKH